MTANAPLTDSAVQQPAPQQEAPQKKSNVQSVDVKRTEALAKLGLTEDDVARMKQQYGKIELVFIGDQPYIYRPLFRQELKSLRKGLQGADELTQEEKIVVKCLLAPKVDAMTMSHTLAGLATTLSTLIYAASDYEIDARPVKL